MKQKCNLWATLNTLSDLYLDRQTLKHLYSICSTCKHDQDTESCVYVSILVCPTMSTRLPKCRMQLLNTGVSHGIQLPSVSKVNIKDITWHFIALISPLTNLSKKFFFSFLQELCEARRRNCYRSYHLILADNKHIFKTLCQSLQYMKTMHTV